MSRFGTLILVALMALAATAHADIFTKHSGRIQVGPNPTAIVAEDLNADGIPDIVTADRGSMMSPREERPANDELSLLESQGPMSFIARPPLKAGFAPYCVVAANIDALKAPDLVVGSFHDARRRHITLFRNLGESGFEPLTYSVPDAGLRYARMRDSDQEPLYTLPGITSLAVREMNHDEFRDVVATGWSSDVLIFFPGDRDAYFGEPILTPAPGGPRDVQTADLNGDGEVDLVTSMYNSGEIVVWRGAGNGTFTEANRFSSRGPLPHKVRLADFNGDGRTDIAVSHCFTTDAIMLFFADPEGSFTYSVSQEISMSQRDDRQRVDDEIRDFIVEDLNGDGKADIAAACYASARICVFVNVSQGTGAPVAFHREIYSYKDARPRALCAADFNADGKMDLAIALWQVNAVAFLLGQ
ncbi:MAG TPA: VCBS repeat-containing protein [Candidatus Hydrogenedentes bacterium]|nr:VCBS repeat-containing protein [Candidatus Hydrogenedentota bacterium]HRK36555.1 VCBS repeat-containing protein [Candidatus Hydrogenedentota bacterium]